MKHGDETCRNYAPTLEYEKIASNQYGGAVYNSRITCLYFEARGQSQKPPMVVIIVEIP